MHITIRAGFFWFCFATCKAWGDSLKMVVAGGGIGSLDAQLNVRFKILNKKGKKWKKIKRKG